MDIKHLGEDMKQGVHAKELQHFNDADGTIVQYRTADVGKTVGRSFHN